MILPIVAYGTPILKKEAIDVDIKQTSQLHELIFNMFETMYKANGVGLAAPQINQSIRVFIVDTLQLQPESKEQGIKEAFINPIILSEEGDDTTYEEGCLSIPDIRADITRKEKITIEWYDQNFNIKEKTFNGFNARVIQHEYDHIEGKLFIDYLKPLKKRMIQSKLKAISKGKIRANYKMKFPN